MKINWYPGHMAKTERMMEQSIKQVDAVVELLDARIPRASRNPQLDELVGGRPRLIALNRSDLADAEATKQWVEYYKSLGLQAIVLDCKSGQGTQQLSGAVRRLLADKIAARTARGQVGRPVRVMVVGVPNVGKSSLINRAAGGIRAKVENRPGVTRGKQWIRVGDGVELLDTPGILWPKIEDEQTGLLLAFTGAIGSNAIDEETLAYHLMILLKERCPQALLARYRLDVSSVADEDLLEALARKRGLLAPGGIADIERAVHLIITEFRNGLLGRMTLEDVS